MEKNSLNIQVMQSEAVRKEESVIDVLVTNQSYEASSSSYLLSLFVKFFSLTSFAGYSLSRCVSKKE